jgi:hypothetical protein
VIAAARFFEASSGPLKQGDILLAGVTRLMAEDQFSPASWEGLDEYVVTVEDARPDGSALRAALGPALVMVTSHDCHFDKEWNRRRGELMRSGLSAEQAEQEAEQDASLDRTFTASPLVDPDDVNVDRGNLLAGNIVGYLPVPASHDGLVPEAVVDLTYRCTIDRLDVFRVSCVSNTVRAQLRYALARLDSLRATELGFEVEEVLGHNITKVEIPRRDPIAVRLHLDNGTTVDLLQHPGEPEGGASRAAGPPDSTA